MSTPIYSSSVSLVVGPQVGPPPRLTGWGGIFADGYTAGPASVQDAINTMLPRGYNAFRCMIYNADFPYTPSTQSVIDAVNLAKQNNIWIILDYHGYDEPVNNQAGWLSFWSNIITSTKDLYGKIIYEPINEPRADPTTLSSFYQAWLNQCRSLGAQNWFIVSPGIQETVSPSNPFPTVNDPLSRIVYSWHEYYFYQYHQSTWSFADADAFADMVAGGASLVPAGAPIIMTEFGADSVGGGGGSSGGPPPPDIVVSGSAGYAPESLEYTQHLIDNLKAINAGYMLWPGGSWPSGGSGDTGAMNVWGQLLTGPP